MTEDAEWSWATLLVEGPDRLSTEQSHALIEWLEARQPEEFDELRPTEEREASHLLDWSIGLLYGEQRAPAAVPARLALGFWDRLVSPGRRAPQALIVAAHAALRDVSVASPRVPKDIETLVGRARALVAGEIADAAEVFPLLYGYGRFLSERRRDDDAEAALRLTLRLIERTPQAHAAVHAGPREELALVLLEKGAHDEAERLLLSAIELRASGEAEARAGIWRAWLGLGVLMWRRQRWPEAERALLAAQQAALASLGEDSEPVVICRQHLTRFERDWLYDREQAKLFGWALRDTRGNPFARAVAALLKVADVVGNPDDADLMVAHVARLQIRAGEISVALDLVDRRLMVPRAEWDGAGAYADAVDVLLSAGDRAGARDVLARGFARAAQIRVFERVGEDAAQHDLVERIGSLEHPGLAELAREALPANELNIVRERDLERAVEQGDLGAVRSVLAEWDWVHGSPGEWLMRDIGGLAAEQGDLELARRMAQSLRAGKDAYLAVDVLAVAGWHDEAETVLAGLEPGWPRGNGLAVAARRLGERGERERFDDLARRAVAEMPAEHLDLSMALHEIARGARACLSVEEAEAWAMEHLPEEAREVFLDRLQPPEPPVELSALAAAIALRDWELALLELRSVGNGYLDLVHAEMLAEPAAAAERHDIVAAALRFALARLSGPFADERHRMLTKEEFRFLTARRLGMAAHRLLPPAARVSFAEDAFVEAAVLDDMPSAAALVIAAGLACRTVPSEVRYIPPR